MDEDNKHANKTTLGHKSASESLPKAGGCRRLSAWPGLWRLSSIPLGAEAGGDLDSDISESGDEF